MFKHGDLRYACCMHNITGTVCCYRLTVSGVTVTVVSNLASLNGIYSIWYDYRLTVTLKQTQV